MKKNKYQITIIRPGGNDQLLIKGNVDKQYRRALNDEMIKRFPNVEQVSFYEFDDKKNTGRLELAGGEFCGNATRSLAYLLLNGKTGTIRLKVSGAKRLLTTGVRRPDTAFAQMPIITNRKFVEKISEKLFRVDLEGITHLVSYENVPEFEPEDLKNYAKKILEENKLLFSVPAAGVMFVEKQSSELVLRPVVWVRDIETILYETACASGTTAVGLCESLKNKNDYFKTSVQQPSGQSMSIEIIKNGQWFRKATIDGPVSILYEGSVLC